MKILSIFLFCLYYYSYLCILKYINIEYCETLYGALKRHSPCVARFLNVGNKFAPPLRA